MVPTGEARIFGRHHGLFTFDFYAHQKGNNSIKVSGTVEIPCSDTVVIFFPTPLSSSLTKIKQSKVNALYMVDEFSTDDLSCPINSYAANEYNKTLLPDGMTQPKCRVPSNTQACRSVSIYAKNTMKKEITFTATADGGASLETNPIGIEILEYINTYLTYFPSNISDICTHREKFSTDP